MKRHFNTAHDRQGNRCTHVQLADIRIDAATAYRRRNTYLLQKHPGQCPNSHDARANAPIFHAALRLSCLPQGLSEKRVASDHDEQRGVWKTFFRAEWQSPTNTPRDRKTLAPTMSDKHNPPVYDLGKGYLSDHSHHVHPA